MEGRSARSAVAGTVIGCLLAAAVVLGLSACVSNTDAAAGAGAPYPSTASAAASPEPTSQLAAGNGSAALSTAPQRPPTSPVHASLLESDGLTYGVGMPIIMRFDASVTDPTALEQAVTVDVDGAPAGGAWYWFTPTEAHYRLENYWPAGSTITMNAPLRGLSAGQGLAYDDDLTLEMLIGDAHISTVDADSLLMTVTSNGAVVNTLPVSLGKAATPTYQGAKVIMEKDRVQRMVGPGYDEDVPWSLRITNSGEFVHAADWNTQIGEASTSNGCTNLETDAAIWMFNFSLIGDVVLYPNAPGPQMSSWDGYGDWNLDWPTWQGGGAL
ncbi:MAG: L,D-transpeptidase [Frankiaceae bacterium]|nr:L,D-transpeptidase [Frankiaceae bacterium]